MVRQVEKLGTKLEVSRLGDPEVFKDRKVKPVETRPDHLIRRPAEGAKVALADGSGRERVRECVGVHPLIDVMFPAVDILPRDKQRIAGARVPVEGGAGPRSDRRHVTRNVKGLAILEGQDPVQAPPRHDLVRNAAGACHKGLAAPYREFITATEMQDIACIEVRQRVVSLDAESGDIGGPVAAGDIVQQVARIRPNL